MDVTDVIGEMGRAQKKALFALLLRPLPGAFIYLSMQISLIELNHWCSPTPSYTNLTSDEWKDCCVPKTGSGAFSKCEYYDVESDNPNGTLRILTCDRWDYDRSQIAHESTRADWNLVCHNGWYVSMLYLTSVVGNLVSYVPTGHLSDRFGRKPTCVVALLLGSAVNLGSAFCTTVGQMMITRFLTGLVYAAVQNPFMILYMECVGKKYRNWVILSFSGSWGLSVVIVAALSYFITNWRTMFILSSFPVHIPLLFILWRYIPESARWLLSVKKYKEAEAVIMQQTKENGIKIDDPEKVMEQLKKKVEMDKEKQGRVTFLDLLKDRNTLRITVVIYISFILTVFINHGYHLSIGRLGGSLHVNLMLNGAVDIIATFVFFALVKKISKRKALLLTCLGTGICFLLTLPIGEDLRWLRITFALIGRLCNMTAYNILYVFASEIFPTSLRVVGVSGGMSSGRIGSLMASFADDMGRVYGRNAPITLFGILSLFTSAILLLLPEVTNRNLPDSLAESRMVASGASQPQTVEVKPVTST